MTRRTASPAPAPGRALFVLPAIPDVLDEHTKNALAIRNAASITGTCPDCGATPELHRDTRDAGIYHGVFRHGHTCRVFTDGAAA